MPDREAVLVPHGYYRAGTTRENGLGDLSVTAGPVRFWRFRNEPAQSWLMKPKA